MFGVHVPSVQVSVALQQSVCVAHAWYVSEHCVAACLQVPAVAPAGMSHVRPWQQSEPIVQLLPSRAQGVSHFCVVALHELEQQFASYWHVAPFGVHWAHEPPTQAPGPAQQGVPLPGVHEAPSAVHVVVVVQT
jgi:hypothetical protein